MDLLFRISTDISGDFLSGHRNIISYSLSKTNFTVLGIYPFFVFELFIDILFELYTNVLCVSYMSYTQIPYI